MSNKVLLGPSGSGTGHRLAAQPAASASLSKVNSPGIATALSERAREEVAFEDAYGKSFANETLIGLPSVAPRPWRGGVVDEGRLGVGVQSWPLLAASLRQLDDRFNARSQLRRYQPLGEASYVTLEVANPRRFLAGPAIVAYLHLLRFQDDRYDGVFVVVRHRGKTMWAAFTEGRIGSSGSGGYDPLVGRGKHPQSELPDQNAPAAKACAAAGIAFS